ncbi:myosin heavy chain, clone 203-like [Pseudochaenichthys georgianus]|uniref:myosin heavy chain, clone 203-like n=1 Tax=Pseudochaenichthys georgianus TaxID=52239 RepID=UPI00146B2DB2|nr:restin homolog [Pseudochaenichthys georgianus]
MADRTPFRHNHSVISFLSFHGERLLQKSSQPSVGSWHAPMFASAHTDVVQGHNNGEHLAMSPKSLLQPLDQVLLYAEEKLKKQSLEEVALREEIAKMALKQVSTSEALEELMGFQTQANEEKEAMEAKINEMEEDFKKEKTTWSDLSCQRLEEISSLGTELLDARSHIDHLKEENAKLTMKDDSISEALKELMGLHTQAKTEMEAKVNHMEEDFNKEKKSLRTELSVLQSHIDHLKEENAKLTMKDDSTSEAFEELFDLQPQAKMEKEDFNKEKTSLKMKLPDAHSNIHHLKEELLESRREAEREITSLQERFSIQIQESSATVDHWREVVRGTEEEPATTLRESKEAWQARFKELEENIESKGGLISSLIDQMRASADSKYEALEETYQTELTEKENSVAEMMLPKKPKKKWWERRLHLRRQLDRAIASTSRDGLRYASF